MFLGFSLHLLRVMYGVAETFRPTKTNVIDLWVYKIYTSLTVLKDLLNLFQLEVVGITIIFQWLIGDQLSPRSQQ